ncbi:MAG: hypothetical protein ACT4PZ_12555 [Panacagrimonas sp.]
MKSLNRLRAAPLVLGIAFALYGCGGGSGNNNDNGGGASDGPVTSVQPVVHLTGDVARGRNVFRFELFGTEGFWTDALRLQQGVVDEGITPIDALGLGLQVDSDMLSPAMQQAIALELMTNLSPANAPLLNSPATTLALINANAVIGIVAVDSNNNGTIDIANGDKTGASCALCHTVTDESVFAMAGGGSIGKRLDGRANHNLNFGSLIAAARNSRAYYPVLQLALGPTQVTLGRAPIGLTEDSTEAEVDAYLSNPAFYPIGTFDDTVDGNGDPMHNSTLFRTDLGAPWGTEGGIARLDNFGNLVYTALLDPTTLTTPGGRAFLAKFGGAAAGAEIADDYEQVLDDTNVTGYPFVDAVAVASSVAGTEEAPLGIRVNNQKLIDMNAYLNSLEAPAGVVADASAAARGREVFRRDCTSCHNVDQSLPVPAFIVPMASIFPGDNPVTLLAMRDPPFNPILNTVNSIFDDKMAVVNASQRGEIRGTALPMLLDLARKPNFLHDNSVASLPALLNPNRGANAPHPFYLSDTAERADMVEFLRGLDTSP